MRFPIFYWVRLWNVLVDVLVQILVCSPVLSVMLVLVQEVDVEPLRRFAMLVHIVVFHYVYKVFIAYLLEIIIISTIHLLG